MKRYALRFLLNLLFSIAVSTALLLIFQSMVLLIVAAFAAGGLMGIAEPKYTKIPSDTPRKMLAFKATQVLFMPLLPTVPYTLLWLLSRLLAPSELHGWFGLLFLGAYTFTVSRSVVHALRADPFSA